MAVLYERDFMKRTVLATDSKYSKRDIFYEKLPLLAGSDNFLSSELVFFFFFLKLTNSFNNEIDG